MSTAILVVGEALIDVVVHPDGRRVEHPGGSPANVALTLGRLGHPPTLLTCVCDDARGRLIQDWLAQSHVHLDPRSIADHPTAVAIARLDDRGAAHYEFDIRWELPELAAAPAAVDLLHIGSMAATTPPGAAVVRRLAESRGPALLSYDPNIRPALIPDPARTRAMVSDLVGLADLVKASDEDLAWLDAEATGEQIAHRWIEQGPALVIVTRGGDSVTAVSREGTVTVHPPQVTVADTIGAGDTLMGALLTWLAEHLDHSGSNPAREQLEDLDLDSIREALTFATAAAAVTVSRAGADPPWRHELSALGAFLGFDPIAGGGDVVTRETVEQLIAADEMPVQDSEG